MILEGIVTTLDSNAEPHSAPMGPRFGADPQRFLLRPFPTSTTFQNLVQHGEAVLHITDDVLLMACAAVGRAKRPDYRRAKVVRGFVIASACRALEFRVTSIDRTAERMGVECEIVHEERLRDFWGFNRAKHAVLEAAILCTRLHLIPREEVVAEFCRLKVIVEKTAGSQEFEAFDFLERYLHEMPTTREAT